MNITVTLTADSTLVTLLQSIAGSFAPSTKQTSQKKKEELPVSVATTSAPETKTEAVKAETAAPATSVTIEQIRAAVQAKKDTKRNEMKALLKDEFGVDNITALVPDQYPAFKQKIDAL